LLRGGRFAGASAAGMPPSEASCFDMARRRRSTGGARVWLTAHLLCDCVRCATVSCLRPAGLRFAIFSTPCRAIYIYIYIPSEKRRANQRGGLVLTCALGFWPYFLQAAAGYSSGIVKVVQGPESKQLRLKFENCAWAFCDHTSVAHDTATKLPPRL
jgi:hypothetical protein